MADGTTLGSAYVQIIPKAEGITGSISSLLGDDAGQAGENAGESMGSRLLGAAKKMLVAGAAGKLIKDSISAGGELEQSIGGIETLFGAGGRSLEEYAQKVGKSTSEVKDEYNNLMEAQNLALNNANQAYKTAGMSANEYMQNVTSFSASLKQSLGGDTMQAAKIADMAMIDMSDNANKMGTSMESITNAYQGFAKQNYTMLDNLKLGYGGTKTEMERLLKDAEAIHERTTGEVTHYDINNLADVYNAIHDVQGELDITGTTAKEAASTMQGSMNMLKASWMNLLGNLALGNDLTQNFQELFNSMLTVAKNFIPALWNVVKGIPTAIINAINEGAPKLFAYIDSNSDAIKEKAAEIVPKILKGALSLLKSLGTLILQSAPLILGAIGELIGLAAVGAWNWAKAKLSQLWSKIKTSASSGFESIKSSIMAKLSAIVSTVAAKANNIKEKFLAPVNAMRDKIKAIIDKIKGFFHFKVSTPHIPTPHFSVSPSGWKLGDLLKGSVPSLGIRWYAEGGIMTKPTLFGGGEAGPEGIIPLDPLWTRLDAMASNSAIDYDQLAGAMVRALSGTNQEITLVVDSKVLARTTAPYLQPELNKLQRRNDRKLGYI